MIRPPFIRPTPLLFLAIALAGCSSTAGPRFGGNAQSRSIAVVGDRPLPATVGEPGGQVAAGPVEPEPRRNPRARISGRVVDDQGRPVPDATVRLADGGVKGGRDIRARTDESGAFTLGGLRPGSTYSLIAEADGDHGAEVGRAEARTSDVGVRISLARQDAAAETNGGRVPRNSRIRPISSREDGAESGEPDDRARVNSEDLPPAAEDLNLPEDRGGKGRPARPQLFAPEATGAWRKAGEPSRTASATPRDPETPADPPREIPADDPEDEEKDPLPPAIDTGPAAADEPKAPVGPTSARPRAHRKVGNGDTSASASASATGGAGQLALATEAQPPSPSPGPARPGKSKADDGPPPMPPLGTESEPAEAPAANGPTPILEPGPGPAPAGTPPGPVLVRQPDPPGVGQPPDPPGGIGSNLVATNPASGPVFASQSVAPAASPSVPEAPREYNPFALVEDGRAAGADRQPAGPSPEPAPAVEADQVPTPGPALKPSLAIPRKKWGDLAASDPAPKPAAKPGVEPIRASLLGRRLKSQDPPKGATVSLCNFDPKAHKLDDFRLPDLEGKPVRFRDLDADFVLLDFWGTWCKPCLDSIPHLVDLQKQYGPGRLKVVGIACEKTPLEHRRARVDEFARKAGINYTVLVTSMDGTCPVQDSFQIRYYPTMILLDRKGQVLWTAEGATPANLYRLDRALASASPRETVRR